jgi:hypothetical protein
MRYTPSVVLLQMEPPGLTGVKAPSSQIAPDGHALHSCSIASITSVYGMCMYVYVYVYVYVYTSACVYASMLVCLYFCIQKTYTHIASAGRAYRSTNACPDRRLSGGDSILERMGCKFQLKPFAALSILVVHQRLN